MNMKIKNELMATNKFVTELIEVTKVAAGKAAGKDHATADRAEIIEYAKSVKQIHESLLKSFDRPESHSKDTLRFLSQWNNLALGVFYSSDIAIEEKILTKRQYDIFINTLEEIIEYGKKHFDG